MEMDEPKKGYLYTWNFVDGFVGLPKRKINLRRIKPTLLHVTYLGGGHRWDSKGTPSGALLCLILTASPRRNQSKRNYYKFYENYNIKTLREIFNAKTEELSGGGCAWWSIEFDCLGWTDDQIDAKIEEVLKWHNQEIERIEEIEDTKVKNRPSGNHLFFIRSSVGFRLSGHKDASGTILTLDTFAALNSFSAHSGSRMIKFVGIAKHGFCWMYRMEMSATISIRSTINKATNHLLWKPFIFLHSLSWTRVYSVSHRQVAAYDLSLLNL